MERKKMENKIKRNRAKLREDTDKETECLKEDIER
jgi:hypothetical protein